MVLANRTPPGSQRSTWVERGHATPARSPRVCFCVLVLPLLWSCSLCHQESKWIRVRARGVVVPEWVAFLIAMPRSLRRGAKPSVGDIADSEGFAVRVRSIGGSSRRFQGSLEPLEWHQMAPTSMVHGGAKYKVYGAIKNIPRHHSHIRYTCQHVHFVSAIS